MAPSEHFATCTSPCPLKRERDSDFMEDTEEQTAALVAGRRAEKRPECWQDILHAPPLHWLPGEPRSSYFRRLAASVDRTHFRAAQAFDADGLYVYKRPVRTGDAMAELLSQAGTVLHHVVLYVRYKGKLSALEFGPADDRDITVDISAETAPAPVLNSNPELPEAKCLPMLHVSAPLHSLHAPHVQAAVAFASARPYHAAANNCIAVADFLARVLTGGAVRGAPLVFDALVGCVPLADSTALAAASEAMGVTWFDIADGGRLTRAFLDSGHAAIAPPPLQPQQLQEVQEHAVAAPSRRQRLPRAAAQQPATASDRKLQGEA